MTDTRVRAYCFTINNYTEKDIETLQGLKCEYLVFGKEIAPETGTPHLQGYIYFANKMSFKKLKNSLDSAHIEEAKGSADANFTYCSKSGNFVEIGVRPQQGKRNDLKSIANSVREHNGGVRAAIDSGAIAGFQALKVYQTLIPFYETKRDVIPHVTYIWGPSGTGKSELARKMCPNAYEKHGDSGKWWDGYDGEKELILDEVRGSSFSFTTLLGILLGPCRVECKGGSRQLQAITIVITSIYPPQELYKAAELQKEPLQQLMRRISSVIHTEFDQRFCPEVGGNTSPDLVNRLENLSK